MQGTRAPWRAADSKSGLANIQDEPGTSFRARKLGSIKTHSDGNISKGHRKSSQEPELEQLEPENKVILGYYPKIEDRRRRGHQRMR